MDYKEVWNEAYDRAIEKGFTPDEAAIRARDCVIEYESQLIDEATDYEA